MQHAKLDFAEGFQVSIGNDRSQAAVMVIAPGVSEGGPGNRHRGADQWLLVTAGSGTAIVNSNRISLKPGTLVLIEAGDAHEIRNDGDRPLETVNIYLPPAYDRDGDTLPAGQP